jgi:predicted N-acyltransferase
VKVTVNDAIADIDAVEWNRLVRDGCPMLRHEFLLAAENSGSVSIESGWTPRHLTGWQDDRLVAAMPLYQKSHSWGEFVFDWSWARAYEQAGLDYYPKLVSALPFTPATSQRLLLAEDADHGAAKALLDTAVSLANDEGISSLHILFPLRPSCSQCSTPAFESARTASFIGTIGAMRISTISWRPSARRSARKRGASDDASQRPASLSGTSTPATLTKTCGTRCTG